MYDYLYNGNIYSGVLPGNNVYTLEVSGSYVTIQRCSWENYNASKYINMKQGAQYNIVQYNSFVGKPANSPAGNLIQVLPSETVPNYHIISRNIFRDMPGVGGDSGNECIRIGIGNLSTYVSRTVVEYNYFFNTGGGDSEAISNKSRENVIRFNTNDNNPLAMFVFRNGDRNVAYGNWFINGSGGIRVKQANDIYIYNNYFETSGLNSPSTDAFSLYYFTASAKNINIIHNTFVNAGNIDLGGSYGADAAQTSVLFANNLMIKTSAAATAVPVFSNLVDVKVSFANNLYSAPTLGLPAQSGLTSVTASKVLSPTKNASNYYSLSTDASNPAVDAGGSATYPSILDIANVNDDPFLLLDVTGSAVRPSTPSLKDIGCEERVATPTIKNRPLTPADVGPSAYTVPSTTTTTTTVLDLRFPTISSCDCD